MSFTIDLGDALMHGHGVLKLPAMTHEEFWSFCLRNPDLNVERSADGDLILMAPTGGDTGNRSLKIARFLDEWADADGTGLAFDSSTLFRLPNGAERSPDASWIRFERWNILTEKQRSEPPPLCPDFVVELMSPSDRFNVLDRKMCEYIENGSILAVLIDRMSRRLHVYRPNQQAVTLEDPAEFRGDPELPGLFFPMNRIF